MSHGKDFITNSSHWQRDYFQLFMTKEQVRLEASPIKSFTVFQSTK